MTTRAEAIEKALVEMRDYYHLCWPLKDGSEHPYTHMMNKALDLPPDPPCQRCMDWKAESFHNLTLWYAWKEAAMAALGDESAADFKTAFRQAREMEERYALPHTPLAEPSP